MVSVKIFDQIKTEIKPNLRKEGKLLHAGGEPIKDWGKCNAEIKLDNVTVNSEIIIADIQDDALLGMDILKGTLGKPADIILSQNKIILNGNEIKCEKYIKNITRQVKAADHYVIQGHTEQIIDVFVERTEHDDNYKSTIIIEPTQSFKENFPLVTASSLAEINGNPTCKVRVMNPFPTDISINQDTIVGTAEIVTEDTQKLLTCESDVDQSNIKSARRLQFIQNKANLQDEHAQNERFNIKQTKETSKSSGKRNSSKTLIESVPEHLKSLYAHSAEGKNLTQQQQIAETLTHYKDVFSKNETDLGLTHLAEHIIDTGTARPIKQPFRRTPMAFAGEEKKAIEKLQQQCVIRPSNSPWASPILLVRKKDGTVRPCVDYRSVNKVTKVDAFPIPKVDQCIDAVAGATIFSTLDLTSGYFQVPVREEDIPKTAFTTKHGLFEFTSTPFGMTNSGATFQRVMELALKGLQWQTCIIYIDDIIVFGSDFDEHIQRLRSVLERFRQANLKLKATKCELLKETVTFLGYKVTATGIKPDPNNVAKILQWAIPTNVTEVRQFLGLCSYYRKHVRNFSSIAKPLFDLTKNDSQLKWTSECQNAFDILKQELTSPKIMTLPRNEGKFILDVDASDFGIGAVLSQMQEGREKVISYASRSLNKAERNYCVTDKELLAIRYFVEYFRHYLMGQEEFIVRSDHRALKWLFSFKSPKGRIARWLEILSGYTFTIEYRQGNHHGNADGLSRCPNPRDCTCPNVDTEEILKCGPCKKCVKRAEEMESNLPKMTSRLVNPAPSQDTTSHHINYKGIATTNSSKSSIMKESERSSKAMINLLMLIISIYMIYSLNTKQINTTKPNEYTAQTDQIGIYLMILILTVWTKVQWAPNINEYMNIGLTIQILKKIIRGMTTIMSRTLMYSWKIRNKVVDMCRTVTTRSDSAILEDYIPWSSGYSLNDLHGMQRSDPDIRQVVEWVETGERPQVNEINAVGPAARHYLQCWDALVLKNGILLRKFEKKDGSGSYLQLVTPRCLQKDVLYQMHNSVLAGHLGRKKTREKLLQRYYWHGVREDIYLWIAQCDNCGANKPPVRNPRAPLGSMPAGAPLDRLATDILGPLPRTPRGNRYILVVTDAFTKWVEIFPIPDQTAETTARTILNEVISRFGSPVTIHSDQGSNYESKIFAELCKMLEIRKTRTSVRNPKCNGQTERFNKTLVRMIRAYLSNEENEWDLNLGCLAAAYRATPNESTAMTPNLLMLGKEVRLPAEIAFGSTTTTGEMVSSYGEYVRKLKDNMQKAHDICRQHLKDSTKRQTDIYDARQSLHQFAKGDIVWFLKSPRNDVCNKLQMPYAGPFLITEKLNNQNYKLQFTKSGDHKIVHYDKLKPYLGTNPPQWIPKLKNSLQ